MITHSLDPKTSRRTDKSYSQAMIYAELVQRFNQGDESAFFPIVENYRNKIFATVLNMLHNHTDAEEITQDTFIRAYRGLAKFRGDASLSTWLYRIAVNLARNRYWYFFRRQRQNMVSLDYAMDEETGSTFADLVAAETQDPAQETANAEFTALIEECMQKLEPKHRKILFMRNGRNLSYYEIATELHINVGTVKSRIARARKNLRTAMAAVCPEFSDETVTTEYFVPSTKTYGQPTLAYA